jgi:phenylacetate-CoA ligase
MEVVKGDEPVLPGEQGEIVVTNLMNYAMPLIRYRVGDIGTLGKEPCSCGRGLPLLKSIEGRKADCFTLPGNRLVTPRTIMTTIQGTPGVSRYQAVQESTTEVRIELMGRDDLVSKNELAARCREVLGQGVSVEVSVTDRKNVRAKFRPVISRLTVAEEPRWTAPRG